MSRLKVIHEDWPDRRFPEFGARVENPSAVELLELTRKYGFLISSEIEEDRVYQYSSRWKTVPQPGIYWYCPHSDGDNNMTSIIWCRGESISKDRSTGVISLDSGVKAALSNFDILRRMNVSSHAMSKIDEAEEVFCRFQKSDDLATLQDALSQMQNIREMLKVKETNHKEPAEFVRAFVRDSNVHEHIWNPGDILSVCSNTLHCRMNGRDRGALVVADIHN